MFKKAVAIFLGVLVLALMHNKLANWHTHIVNGVVITHAHPNSDNSKHHHSHSKSDFTVVNILSGYFYAGVQIYFLPKIYTVEISVFIREIIIRIEFFVAEVSNKSPPYLTLLGY